MIILNKKLFTKLVILIGISNLPKYNLYLNDVRLKYILQ